MLYRQDLFWINQSPSNHVRELAAFRTVIDGSEVDKPIERSGRTVWTLRGTWVMCLALIIAHHFLRSNAVLICEDRVACPS
jgi:hypothetical protein